MPEPAGEPNATVLLLGAADARAAAAAALEPAGVQLTASDDRAGAEAALARGAEVMVVSPGGPLSTREAIELCQGRAAVVVCGLAWDDAEARAALDAGAEDYVAGDGLGARLAVAVRRAARTERTRRRLALYESVVDGLPFVLFVKDAEELRMRVVNRTGLMAFRTTADALLGKNDNEMFPPDQAQAFMAMDREVLATGKPRETDERVRNNTEDRVFHTRKIPLYDARGQARWVMGVTEDVTDLRAANEREKRSQEQLAEANKRLEDNLQELKRSRATSARTLASYQQRALQMEIIRQQNEDLDRLAQDLAKAKRLSEERAREIESAARLKSEFLANFSHEIRTPLNGILGYCELLVREEGSRLTPHGRRDLQVIKTNAKTLLALINDILDLSKIEAGHVEVVASEVDLRGLVDECTATVREYLQGKDVVLSANVSREASTVVTDGLKLRQILLNLLSNAAKFTDTGEIVVDARRNGDTLVVSVEDTGTGIPQDQLPFVFEKFRQVDGSSTRKVGGTGLGLAIVRELSRVLGGSVEVSSVLGRGSVFTIRLVGVFNKAADAPDTVVGLELPESTNGGAATVLVVDDDPLIHQLVRGQLEREGMRVLVAHDGVEALKLAREHRPSAIMLDIYLPKIDGWAVLTELKSDPALASLPVVLISVEEQRARGISLGATEYLVKPFDPDQLLAVVNRLISPGSGEVLVVDDDASTRELVSRQLRRAGFSSAEARTGEEALLRTRVTRPSLIVLDLALPDIDGFEVLRRVREVDAVLPVLVLTGRTLSDADRARLREGMASVVQKGGRGIEQVVAEARRLLMKQRSDARVQLPRVLYVEDSAQNRDVVRRYLRDTFEVLEAEDGEHGLERAGRDRPDVILMDLSLPRLDGWEATRRLKANQQTAAIPVIALTAHASREDQARARAAGCDGYLTKPVERDTLINTIRQYLASRAQNAS